MENKPRIIVTVHRPDLTPEERARRMGEIKRAATALITASMQNQARARSSNDGRLVAG